MPDENEIDEVMNECGDHENEGTTKFPGMSYEQGVKAAIEWLSDDYDGANPMDD